MVLKNKGWKGSHRCVLCGDLETKDHIFFRCSLARFMWCVFRDFFGWDRIPVSTADFWETWLPSKLNILQNIGIFFFAGFTWALWKIRNKMAIEKKFPNPTDVVFSGISFLQKWEALLKGERAAKVDQVLRNLMTTVSLRDQVGVVSDIVDLCSL